MVATAQPFNARAVDYYLGLAGSRGDDGYFVAGPEPVGVWCGTGADYLDLSGAIDPAKARQLFDGFSPAGNVQNAGAEERRAGVDLCFSAPKSVSLLWALGDEHLRKLIEICHETALRAALDWFERNAAFCRTGKAGENREPAQVAFALFQHGSARAAEGKQPDPQLHTHCLVANLAVTADGKVRALDTAELLVNKMLLGAIYHCELSNQLEARLGVACAQHRTAEKHSTWFEVEGVPQGLRDHFSSRRADLLERLAHKGVYSAEAAAIANLETRQPKQLEAREVLFTRWQAAGRALGYDAAQCLALCGHAPQRDTEQEAAKALERALQRLTSQHAHFTERQLLRATLEEAQARGLWAARVERGVKEALQLCPELVNLGRRAAAVSHLPGEIHYTTREMLRLEKRLLDAADRLAKQTAHRVPTEIVDAVLEGRSHLSQEQAAALRHVTCEQGSIKLVNGAPGTGKSTFLEAARCCWESQGYHVVGATLSGKAAEGLELSSGIKSYTIAALTGSEELGIKGRLDQGVLDDIVHHGRQLVRTALGKTAVVNERVTFDANTVLVIDECGMVGTKALERLVREAERARAQVVLVGDVNQLTPIEAGGPFKSLGDRLGRAELTQIIRQKDWTREAVQDFARGAATEGLRRYAERGLVHVAKDREAAIDALVAAFAEDGLGGQAVKEKLALVGTNYESAVINAKVQAARLEAGQLLDGVSVGNAVLREGDRCLFTRNNKVLGVKNGSLGTVQEVDADARELSVRLDSTGELVRIPLNYYQEIRLGYATTGHKAQGATVDRAFVLAGGALTSKEHALVQMSRHRDSCQIFVDRLEAGEDLELLSKSMARSRAKDLAHDVARDSGRDLSQEVTHEHHL